MPRSPCQLTMASFLKKAPDISPLYRKGKGNKRKLSTSPNSLNVASSKKPNGVASTNASPPVSDFPPLPEALSPLIVKGIEKSSLSPPFLPYQLRSSPKFLGNKKQVKANPNAIMNSPSLSSMDDNLLEMDQEDVPILDSFPTSDEADALLREDAPCKPPSISSDESAPSSPTAAVTSAIEAQIAENLSTLSTFNIVHDNSNKDNVAVSAPAPTLTPFSAPPPLLKKPQPLFPDGLPFSTMGVSPASSTSSSSGNARGYFTAPRSEASKVPGVIPINPKPKPTYATKAKSPPKARVQVQNILYVYSTSDSKKDLSPGDWETIDQHLILKEVSQEPGNCVKIAKSGYDSVHKCGYIACKNLVSENWVKDVIRCLGGGPNLPSPFRAWSRGEQPETRVCRLFFPTRFDCLHDNMLVPILLRHNPSLSRGTFSLKESEIVQGGRAIFLEMDAASYGYVKSKDHKLEFTMMDVDCQLFVPKKAKKPNLPHITTMPPTTTSITDNPAPIAPTQSQTADPRLAKTLAHAQNNPLVKSTPEKRKRETPGLATSTFIDSAKKVVVSKKPQKE